MAKITRDEIADIMLAHVEITREEYDGETYATKALRNKIWAAFRPGQEISRAPSQRYVQASREVQAWIKDSEARKASERLF